MTGEVRSSGSNAPLQQDLQTTSLAPAASCQGTSTVRLALAASCKGAKTNAQDAVLDVAYCWSSNYRRLEAEHNHLTAEHGELVEKYDLRLIEWSQ